MEFSVAKQSIIGALTSVSSVVERRQTLPILSNLLLETVGESLRLTGSDQEIEISAVVSEGLTIASAGSCTAPARKLLDIVKSLPGKAEISITLQDNQLELRSGEFISHLAVLPVADFPKIQIADPLVSFSLPAEQLSESLKATSFAMASQDVRYFFNGMLLQISQDKINFVASNGQRLALASIKGLELPTSTDVIVPRKGIAEMQLLLQQHDDDVMVALTPNHIRLNVGSSEMIGKLIDGTYPDYEQAIPKDQSSRVIAQKEILADALGRTAILSNEMYRSIRLSLMTGQLKLQTSNPLQEDAVETVKVEYSGEDLEVGFNVTYLLEALSSLSSEQVELDLKDSNTAVVIRGSDADDRLMVISPMKL